MVCLPRWRCRLPLALGCVGAALLPASAECLANRGHSSGDAAFVIPLSLGAKDAVHCQKHPDVLRPASSPTTPAGLSATRSSMVAAAAFVAIALLRRSGHSKVVRHVSGIRQPKYYTHERKWWSIEETRDPTTLPFWQRDYRFGYQVLKRTMVESRKRGKKAFWEVRVLEQKEKGCRIEMLNSGLMGWCPIGQEGPRRLEVGEVVKMECVACPQKRLNSERWETPWPQEPRRWKHEPVFSHWLWIEQQRSIEKAKTMEKGTIVDGVVFKHLGRGLVITLEGKNNPKGFLAMMDISRKMSSHAYVEKMFPVGTKIKCYVVHADTSNGRITLSTKEFEDDDHMGWMLSFPERCFRMADEAVRRYHEKRDAYIAMLQR